MIDLIRNWGNGGWIDGEWGYVVYDLVKGVELGLLTLVSGVRMVGGERGIMNDNVVVSRSVDMGCRHSGL